MDPKVTVSTIRLGLIIDEDGIKKSVVTDIEMPRLETESDGNLLAFYIAPALKNLREKVALKDIVTNLQAGTSSILPRQDPKDLEPWAPQLGAHIQDVFIPALDRYDRAMARGLLMPARVSSTDFMTYPPPIWWL